MFLTKLMEGLLKTISSINVSCLPFISSCDTTRLQMAAKQITQALTHPNCEIPYVISEHYRDLSNNSHLGAIKAVTNGKVAYRNDDLLIVHYHKLKKNEVFEIPKVKKTTDAYASTLRYCLNQDEEFKQGDIIYEYDCFTNGVPSFGYNVFTGFLPFFGLNHEDAIVISQDFADKAKYKSVETLCIPIYEYTMMQPIYKYSEQSGISYFPSVGQSVKNQVVCTTLQPKIRDINHTSNDLKQKMMILLKNMNISDLINIQSRGLSSFSVDQIKTKVEDGIVSGIKIHEIERNASLVDAQLQSVLKGLHKKYIEDNVVDIFYDLTTNFGEDFARNVTRKHLVYRDNSPITNRKVLKNCVYILEIEISSEHGSVIGDKLANMHANKGVISEILPNELRPIAVTSNKPIDLILSPFSVFSRMNLSQILEGIVAKSVMYCSEYIKHDPNAEVTNALRWLNDNIIRFLSSEGVRNSYYKQISQLSFQMDHDSDLLQKFVNDVKQSNLFVEAPAFSEVNTNELLQHCVNPNEDVLLKAETIKYMKQKLKIDIPFPDQDVYLKNIFCGPIYFMKLHKLVSHIITARDLGAVKAVTGLPLKGRSRGGGAKIGQMELEGLLAHGTDKATREILTVKSDYSAGKQDLIKQLIEKGEYNFPDDVRMEGGTKKVVTTYAKFLKD